jgi:uncharacterized damage-inducible protein DinB
MDDRELCVARRKAELKAFVNVIKAVPEDKKSYKPDPKARSAAELAWVIATEEQALEIMLDTGVVNWKDTPPPARVADIVAAYEKSAAAVTERVAKLDAAGWQKKGKFVMEGMPAPWETTISEFVWGFLFDEIHHRGQLSTYLRPMGSKVPSIYGPSADDAGGA